MCKQKKSTKKIYVNACKRKSAQTVKPLKWTVNDYKTRTGDFIIFPLLCLETGPKSWYRYYTIFHLYNASLAGFFLFLSDHFLFMLPYLVLQWPYVFHYKAKFNCRSK